MFTAFIISDEVEPCEEILITALNNIIAFNVYF